MLGQNVLFDFYFVAFRLHPSDIPSWTEESDGAMNGWRAVIVASIDETVVVALRRPSWSDESSKDGAEALK